MVDGHRLLLLAGRDADELRTQLAADEAELLARDDAAHAPTGGPCRLAIVDPDARRLALARRVVERGAPWRGRNDVWFSATPLLGAGGGTIAFVFPGVEQRFEPVLDDIAAQLALPLPVLGGEELAVVLRRSIGLLGLGRFLDAALRRIGIVPSTVAGHSIGEWNAMVAGGMLTSEGIDRLVASIDPEAFELPGCLFAALGCGVELAREVIAGIDGVVISHDNCPHQSIICGDEDAVAAAAQRFDERGILSQILNFRSGFHSPLLAPYLEGVSGIARLPIATPEIPVWSATTAEPFPGDESAIRDLVIRHLLEPVRFRELVENLYASGVRAFVQPGVGSVTGFIDDTLAGRDYVAVAANVTGQPGLRQLRRTAAALWVEGAAPCFDKLSMIPGVPVSMVSEPCFDEPSMTAGIEPVLAELRALLAEAAEAAEAVTARFADVRASGARPVRLAPRETRYSWTLRLEEMPYVIDHCLVRQPAGWHDVSDRHPV
ncbi:MAG TPA: acyltransferase domain-containing protein, partial [Candidatus Limnocylindria bacterium]|nr:acyltransferase domain-containing protein [Candidatus Limnocylindria bacterium]